MSADPARGGVIDMSSPERSIRLVNGAALLTLIPSSFGIWYFRHHAERQLSAICVFSI